MKRCQRMEINKIIHGNCVEKLKEMEESAIDLVYFDPPFFTQRKHTLSNRNNSKTYEFDDKYESIEDYLSLIESVLIESKRVLKNTGSVFLHCDKTASHNIRTVLDKVFGRESFQSEIIWSYKRWSNSKKGLLNSHQSIFFYSKTDDFKFKTLYTDYSATTNLNQILRLASEGGDLVLDPFCGSGTTCVSARSLKRNFIGIDISKEAVELANSRLEEMIISKSNRLNKGALDYLEKTEKELAILQHMNAFPVQRNAGIDGFLKEHSNGSPVPLKIVVQTGESSAERWFRFQTNAVIIKSLELQTKDLIKGYLPSAHREALPHTH